MCARTDYQAIEMSRYTSLKRELFDNYRLLSVLEEMKREKGAFLTEIQKDEDRLVQRCVQIKDRMRFLLKPRPILPVDPERLPSYVLRIM